MCYDFMMEYPGRNIGCWLIFSEMRAIGLFRHAVIVGGFV